MTQQTSQSRWQWTVIVVLAAGLLYVGWQGRSGAVRIRDAAEHLVRLQDQLRTAVTEQQEVTQRLGQVVHQVDTAVQGVEAAQSTLETLQQDVDERLTALQNQVEPAIGGQQAEARRLGQLEDQVFTAMTRQQAATQRLTELAGQVESVTQALREARSEVGAVFGGACFDVVQEDVARLEDAGVVGEQAKNDPDQEALEIVSPVAHGIELVVQPPDEFRRLDVDGVLIAKCPALDAKDEPEFLDVAGQVHKGEGDGLTLAQIVKLEVLEVAHEDVARAVALGHRVEIFPGLPVRLAEITPGALLLDDQDARPEQVDEARAVVQLADMLLVARHRPAAHVEHLEELVVEALRLALLVRGVPPLLGEGRRADPHFVP